MAEKALANSSYETYLALEAESDTKYEFHDGFIVAMAGGTPAHSQLGANIVRFMGNALDAAGKPYRVFNSDLKVRIDAMNRTFYPDASVVCEEPQVSDKDPHAVINPVLIVEVLSDSNEKYDRGEKFNYYRQLPSFQEYILVHQNMAMVDRYYRQKGDLWEIKTIRGLDETVELKSLGCALNMRDLYRLVAGIE
ncbi:MAG: Uma2 family endonuclease [Bacteroidia bacterium]|nr:Uma2 family endonuclease [Bacteroidia bacterium]